MKNIGAWMIGTLLLFASCKKTISPTQAEINASNLNNSLNGIDLSSIEVLNMDNGAVVGGGNSITISGDGLAIINSGSGVSTVSTTFNLGLLKAYKIQGNTLFLYF